MKYYSEQGGFPASEIAGTVVGSQRLLLYMVTQSACLKTLQLLLICRERANLD
jgi:hypothetical protein